MNPRGRVTRQRREVHDWWANIKTGRYLGNPPALLPIGPELFLHMPDPTLPLKFIRDNGEEYSLNFTFSTDLGSLPGIARVHKYFTKTYYVIPYLFHDSMFGHNPWPDMTFEKANLICIEGIKTLQTHGYLHRTYRGSRLTASIISAGINSPIARNAYERNTNHNSER